MKVSYNILIVISCISVVNASTVIGNRLINADFEDATFTGFLTTDEANVPGWSTTATNGKIERWRSGFRGVDAANGDDVLTNGNNYFAEVNADGVGALYQDITFALTGTVDYSFLHRGRAFNDPSTIDHSTIDGNPEDPNSRKIDTLRFSILDLDDGNNVLFSRLVSTDNIDDAGEYNGWVHYFGEDVISVTAGDNVRFQYEAVAVGSNSVTIGNFVDNAVFGVNLTVPEPSSVALLSLGGIALMMRRRR